MGGGHVRTPPRPYAPIPLAVLSRRDLDPSDKITLAALILRADDNGFWRARHEDLIDLLGMNEKRLKGSLGKLREVGYLASRRTRWGTAFSLDLTAIQSVQNGGFIQAQNGPNENPFRPEPTSHSGQDGTSFRPEPTSHSGQNRSDVYQEPLEEHQEPKQEVAVVPINGNGKGKPVSRRVEACGHCRDTGVVDDDGVPRRCDCEVGLSVPVEFLAACRAHPPRRGATA